MQITISWPITELVRSMSIEPIQEICIYSHNDIVISINQSEFKTTLIEGLTPHIHIKIILPRFRTLIWWCDTFGQ